MSEEGTPAETSYNRATGIITAVLGTTFAVAGMHHGFFETLQGYTPTKSFAIQSIGPAQVMWKYGTDDAVTIIPNFLITGIAAIVVSLVIVLGSWFGVRGSGFVVRGSTSAVRSSGLVVLGSGAGVLRRKWPTIFLLLFVLLTLVGGGIGQIVFFFVTWAYATRVHKPLTWWRKILSGSFGKTISPGWIYSAAFASICFISGLEISVFGYVPGISNPDSILAVCWGFLLLGLIFINVSYIMGFAYDIEKRTQASN